MWLNVFHCEMKSKNVSGNPTVTQWGLNSFGLGIKGAVARSMAENGFGSAVNDPVI